jgi:taurine dioxygenase
MTMPQLDIRPMTGALGAEIHGVDLAALSAGLERDAAHRGSGAAGAARSRRDLLPRPGVRCSAAEGAGATLRRDLRPSELLRNAADPEIVEIRREPGDTRIVGEEWHTDTTMMPEPPMGAILYAIEVPPYGGDTLFANQYLAYETLSRGMKRLLGDLRAVHSDRKVAGPRAGVNEGRSTRARDDEAWRETVSVHPVVRTHPETGRKCLYVNASYTVGFEA